ncbi:fumarylacetoacetate hydrolase family protein [Azospirillum sp. YIM B02556]|uniref:Fumarylacetoacetate hydrolase family protein n=1 Tax=Azospirillum endophyticum TaxID=2800326 RepID=A0ABS1F631_9PROT|nr:fumarylacetoacetate hydrolase family protein [Azospirillum endophyticum]MBK1838828.1 fumarylacetoacetate hydrolase family protein [Azospirillum endophyticum]
MKLASLKAGGRDGTLVVVSKDLAKATKVPEIAATMQLALDRWSDVGERLRSVYDKLNGGEIADAFELNHADLAAPLPRAYQWCDGSAYLSHAELVRKARGAEMPESLYSDPLIYQGGSDQMIGPRDDIVLADEGWGIDLEAELAVITDDVPMGITAEEAVGHIKLVTILNDVSLRLLMPAELAKGFGFFQSKPSTAFAPVFVTPDELGDAWDGRKLSLPLVSHVNSELLGRPDAGVDLNFDFPTLVAHATKSRSLGAGTIIGSGTVSNRDRSVGSSCLQERRMIEKIETGEIKTPFLKFGDVVRVEMMDKTGTSIFGPIEQKVVRYERPAV